MDLNNLDETQIKALIGLLSSLLPKQEDEQKTKPKQKKTTQSKIKTAKSKTKSEGLNRFDQMPERNSHKEDTLIDQKLSRYPPTERSRQFTPIAVKCRCCGREEQINPGLILERDRYKCNKCAISAG
jgi:hypothetical protein